MKLSALGLRAFNAALEASGGRPQTPEKALGPVPDPLTACEVLATEETRLVLTQTNTNRNADADASTNAEYWHY